MRWIDKLERRYGRYGIPNLLNGILIGQVVVWLLVLFINQNLLYLLPLSRSGVLHGEIWRLLTFMFVPSSLQPFSLLLSLYFYWWIGNALTRAWGDFRFTVYILAGMVGAWLSCFITGAASSSGLFLSLFFAYAWMWPDQQVLLFFILPIKMKWMGWVSLAMWVLQFITGTLSTRVSLVFGLAGFLLFFGKELYFWAHDLIVNRKRRQNWKNQWK